MYKSAFCGIIDEIPGISVDNFENPEQVRARAYFLSHCHSDHTQGLYSEALVDTLKETGACIYMSESSAAIVNNEKTDPRIMEYVRPLSIGTTEVVLPCNQKEGFDEEYISVTLIHAGHSFGSVMFLFKTTSKTVLFTGDFRMCQNDLPKYAHFHNGMDPIHIDAMYVDTTFIGQKYLYFPRRSETMQSLLHLIKGHLQGKDNRIALHTSARYGYESVFNEIYKVLGLKVYAGAMWNIYSKLLHLVTGVTNEENSTKIHLCRNWNEKKDHSKCLAAYQNDYNYLYIHFSAMKWDNFDIEDNTYRRVSERRVDVCFPTHCSRSELIYFVNYFQPRKVVGFPEEFPKDKLVNFRKTVDSEKNNNLKSAMKRKNSCSEKEDTSKKLDKKLLNEVFASLLD